jgi:hypothetical protein
MRHVQLVAFAFMFVLSAVFGFHALRYVVQGADAIPTPTTPTLQALYAATPLGRYRELSTGPWSPVLIVHVLAAGTALLLAPFQLVLGVLRLNPVWHRRVAVPYVIGVFVASLSGFLIAPGAYGGVISTFGFAAFGVAWMFTTARGLVHISQRDLDEHKEWMGRSLALAFGGATIRVWALVLLAMGVPAEVAFPFAAWWGWVSNLIVAEMILRQTIGSSTAAYAR